MMAPPRSGCAASPSSGLSVDEGQSAADCSSPREGSAPTSADAARKARWRTGKAGSAAAAGLGRGHALRWSLALGALFAVGAVAAREAAQVPAVLGTPALQTVRAQAAATLAVARAGARLVAAGERGTVLYSDDHGVTWTQARVPVQVSLTALRFVDERTGWAVGHLGVILRTDDAGASWALQLDGVRAAVLSLQAAQALGDAAAVQRAQRLVEEGPDKAFFDVDFADRDHGLAVGAYNQVFATRDGGVHWHPAAAGVPNPKGLHLYGVRFAGSQVFLAGEQGLLLRSDDGGARFSALPAPYKGSFFGLLATRSGALLAYGLRGNAWRSTDQGSSWRRADTGSVAASFSAATEAPDGTLLLLSQAGELLASRDDGRSFRARAGVQAGGAGIAAGEGAWVVAGLRGTRRYGAVGAP
jgi:photosystem II stability/assembly factor-like uncharacterized protein